MREKRERESVRERERDGERGRWESVKRIKEIDARSCEVQCSKIG